MRLRKFYKKAIKALIKRCRYTTQSVKKFFRRRIRFMRKAVLILFQRALRHTLIENDLIIFESFFGRYISDSPLAIFEKIDQKKYRCFFLVDRPSNFKGYPTLKRRSFRALYYMSKAKIVIGNSRMTLDWEKKEGQVYIQTWHGTPLKRLVYDLNAYDMPIADSFEEYCEIFSRDVVRWDYLLSSCLYASERFRSAFRFDGKILEIGYPRNCKLYYHTDEDILRIKEELGIPAEKQVILYAPTYRDNQNDGVGNYYFNDCLDYNLLSSELGDALILVRYHYIIKQRSALDCENVIDVTDYQNLDDLYLISDMLITDYSSVFFDYSILRRPFFFFVPDLDEYEEKLRGFYLDMKCDFPVAPARTTEDLISQLRQVDNYNFDSFFEIYNPEKNRKCLERTLSLIDDICEGTKLQEGVN